IFESQHRRVVTGPGSQVLIFGVSSEFLDPDHLCPPALFPGGWDPSQSRSYCELDQPTLGAHPKPSLGRLLGDMRRSIGVELGVTVQVKCPITATEKAANCLAGDRRIERCRVQSE